MKKMISMVMVLAAVCAAFGETYEKGKVYGPIEILGDETVTVDGHGAIIDGGNAARCATLGPNVTLMNFTFRNGKAAVGGGVWGGTVTNCTIRDCVASEYGAAVANCRVVSTAIAGCKRPLDGAVKAATHGGIAADSTLEGVTITGCHVEMGTTVPCFGGIAANSAIANCTVTGNALVISGDHYGLLFYGGSLGNSTIQANTVDSSPTNVVAYMKVTPIGCAFDGDSPLPPGPVPPGPERSDFDGSVANNYTARPADGSQLVVSTAKQSGNAVSFTAKLTVGTKTYSYSGGRIENGAVTKFPTSKTYGAPEFFSLAFTRNEMSGVIGGNGFSGSRLTRDVFDAAGFGWRQDSAARVGVAFSAQVSVSESCGPVKYAASKLPSGLTINATTGKITGIPTKKGDFLPRITVTSTVNSKLKTYMDFPTSIVRLDDWAIGTFSGNGGRVKVTVSSVGKLSGKIAADSGTWTFSAKSFDAYSNETYFAALDGKKGKATRTFRLALSQRDGLDVIDATDEGGELGFTAIRLTQENFDKETIGWAQNSPARVGVAFAATLSVSEPCGPVKYSASKLPTGLKVNATTGAITGVPTKAGTYPTQITATSTVSSKFKAKTLFPVTVIEPLDGWATGTFSASGDGRQVALTVSAAGKISGTMTEGKDKWTISAGSYSNYADGTYVVALTCKKGKTVRNIEVSLTADGLVGTEAGGTVFTGFQLRQVNFDAEGSIRWQQISPIRVGVAFSAQLGVGELCGPVKYSASKLPAGLKLNATTGAITGVPTKATAYKTQITATSTISSKFKGKRTFPVEVAALDGWAIGTFNGGGTNCQVALTVSAAGKISGWILEGGRKWTLSAKSFDDYAEGMYTATLACKNGKTVQSCEIMLSEDGLVGVSKAGGEFRALRNCWKNSPWKTISKAFTKAKPVSYTPTGFADESTITLKFSASGAVTAKGQFVKSYSRTGKPSFYSASCSSVLCPKEDPDEAGAFAGVVCIYYPPKKNTPIPSGYIDCVNVRWTGSQFEPCDD